MTASIAPQRGGFTSGNKIPQGYQQGQLQQFTPEQMQLLQSRIQDIGPESFIAKLAGGDQDIFKQLEAPAQRQFSQAQGGIASRFSNIGSQMGGQRSLGSQGSSGFKNTMNQASSDFTQDLQSNRMNLQRQALSDLMGYSNSLMGQRPNEQFLVEEPEKKPKWWQQLIAGLAPVVGAGAGAYFGQSPEAAMAGGKIGNAFGQAFM